MTVFAPSDYAHPITSRPLIVAAQTKSSLQIQIVRATLLDLDPIAKLLTESFHHFNAWNAWLAPVLLRGVCDDLRHRILRTPPPYACLLAYVEVNAEMTLVGTVELSEAPKRIRNPDHLYISNLAVQPKFRRLGIGQQLLMACESIAKDAGYSGLVLHVLEDNCPAQRLYESFGFLPTPMTRTQDWINLFLSSRRLLLCKAFKRSSN